MLRTKLRARFLVLPDNKRPRLLPLGQFQKCYPSPEGADLKSIRPSRVWLARWHSQAQGLAPGLSRRLLNRRQTRCRIRLPPNDDPQRYELPRLDVRRNYRRLSSGYNKTKHNRSDPYAQSLARRVSFGFTLTLCGLFSI